MPNIANVFKDEITRLVRKELKGEAALLKKTNSRYRSEIAELKRRVAAMEKRLKSAERQVPKPSAKSCELPDVIENKLRFRPTGLKTLRDRLDVSAPLLATILGVSPQSVYNWETGTSKPRQDQLTKIAILRKMGKREFQERLAQMQSGKRETAS